jgi:hypothetical protein
MYAFPSAVLCLSLYLFPAAGETILLLARVETAMLRHRDAVPAFTEAAAPGAGLFVLPPQVQVMISMLRTAGADSFRFSEGIGKDGGMMQRLVEGGYPLRCTPEAPFLVSLEGEAVPPGWTILMHGEGVTLAHRP